MGALDLHRGVDVDLARDISLSFMAPDTAWSSDDLVIIYRPSTTVARILVALLLVA